MTDTSDKENQKKEGRIARHSRLAREAREQPSSIVTWSRDWFVRLWVTKGGGFYGLGYVITFVVLELRSISGDVAGSSGIEDFITSQFIQLIIRFSVESFLNALFAVLWPIYLLQWHAVAGLAVLIAAASAYRFVVRPFVEGWFPELREAREEKEALRESKRAGSGRR